ncbi:MAG: ABC transporter ATP-binding protein [Alistipes sp.]|jgi:ABC-type lipoprotein export system ATPase subunit|nr:ABC transporter ATP-binding protein [Alistipes sp.]MBQ5720114.1 ABC transporter ATP-binding protein [Alistipes sp.]MBR0332952.1 ABC transporter ATP-binding protein [Alistipes sp.]
MALIRLTDVEKSFQDGRDGLRRVLRGVNLTLDEGEMVSVRGVSGSGKTTLLSVLGTTLKADAGFYIFDGEDVTKRADNTALRSEKIGFLFQDHRLMPQYTAWENILLPVLATASHSTEEDEQYARELMALLGIEQLADQYPTTLSGGEASRVALCRALIRKPKLLLADEPTGQLDRENAAQVASLLEMVNKRLKTTIIVVTHSEELAEAAARRFVLREGVLDEL